VAGHTPASKQEEERKKEGECKGGEGGDGNKYKIYTDMHV